MEILEFDAVALYDAMDSRRRSRGLSWAQVAKEIWEQSALLNDERRDHPISPSTLTGMPKRRNTSCQHALFMLRWLGRSPESFLVGTAETDSPSVLRPMGPDRRPRWHLKRLYEAMDARRREEKLTWPELAKVLRCSPNQLTGLRTARYATGMTLAMRIVQWLGRPSAAFIYAATW